MPLFAFHCHLGDAVSFHGPRADDVVRALSCYTLAELSVVCLPFCINERLFLRPKRAAPDLLLPIWMSTLLLPIWMSTRLGLPAPWSRCLGGRHLQTDAISSLLLRGDLSHSSACRLVMHIERDSRKTSPGKERQQSGSEYLSRCLDLLIRHIVREVPRLLGKRSLLPGPLLLTLPGLGFFFNSRWCVIAGECSATLSWMCSSKISTCLICLPSYFASVRWWRQGAS